MQQTNFLSVLSIAILVGRIDAQQSSTSTSSSDVAWQTSGTDAVIPGLLNLHCYSYGQFVPPCNAVCGSDDGSCIEAAKSQAATCAPQWSAYSEASASWAKTHFPRGSTTVVTVETAMASIPIYSSSSTDSTESFTNYNGHVYHPIYVFGTPSISLSPYPPGTRTQAFPNYAPPTTVLAVSAMTTQGVLSKWTTSEVVQQPYLFTKPTPRCTVTSVETMDCGKCTIAGGSVQLFYWPSPTSTLPSSPPASPATAVIPSLSLTLTSPSAYISLQAIYAANSCRPIGSVHAGSILTLDPASVSTVYAANGPAYGAGMAKRINYDDLLSNGVVPASVYELNNACARFGCETIANDMYRPTLAIPPQIRELDPAWKGCGLDLEGLYDPPSALTVQTEVPGASLPGAGAGLGGVRASLTVGSPGVTPAAAAAVTATAASTSTSTSTSSWGTRVGLGWNGLIAGLAFVTVMVI